MIIQVHSRHSDRVDPIRNEREAEGRVNSANKISDSARQWAGGTLGDTAYEQSILALQ